jgi:hypothetical protein
MVSPTISVALESVPWTTYGVTQRSNGGYSKGDPPLTIPNREVKPLHADGTAARWKSR